MIQAGQSIQATAALAGDYFASADILIVKNDHYGSIGFITNRSFGKYLADLDEFKDCPPVPLWEGGPVGKDHLYILHRRPDLINGGTPLGNGLYWGGTMDDLVQALHLGSLQMSEFQLFIGYCGWDKDELDLEINEGSWRARD